MFTIMKRCAERNNWVATHMVKVTLKCQVLKHVKVYILCSLLNFKTAENFLFLNNLTQVITIMRWCAERSNWIATSKVKVTLTGKC
jgi:5,10-methylenetetrahydrofolate reductase